MCRNARIPSTTRLKATLGDLYDLPLDDFDGSHEATSFDHPAVPVVTNFEPTKITMSSWGLIPAWVRDRTTASTMANSCRNAVAETMFEKPAFRDAAHRQRCLIFLDGFYEWQHVGKKKQKYYVTLRDSPIMAMGGLWSIWQDPDTRQQWHTCVMITTAANPLMAEIHNSKERQPLILPPSKWSAWLDTGAARQRIEDLCAVYGAENMQAEALAPFVTKLANEAKAPSSTSLGPRPGELF
jgi:putative SOS response-associated peptidase YedK